MLKQILVLIFFFPLVTHAQQSASSAKLTRDDFPVPDRLLRDTTTNYSLRKKQSGEVISYDKVWFTNDSLEQTLVIELYTDLHRSVIFLFENNHVPKDLIGQISLHIGNGETLATTQQKRASMSGFITSARKSSPGFFISSKGLKIGSGKQEAQSLYGHPHFTETRDSIEICRWLFEGENMPGLYNLPKDIPMVKNSFGYQVLMYFRDEKLCGMIIHNDIP